MDPDVLRLIADPAVFPWLCAVLGLLVGSFLNVVIYRLPKMLEQEFHAECALSRNEALPESPRFNLATPRSSCPQCGHTISAWENIPVLSFLFLRGKCAGCQCRISPRYPLIECVSAGLAGLAAAHFGYGASAAGAILLLWGLLALTFIDFDTQYLPDSLTLPLLWGGLLFNLTGTYVSLDAAVIGAMAGYLSLWSIYWGFKLVTGKEGMGYGDFKLLAALGAWLGWQMLPLVILLSALVGAIIGISLIVFMKRGREIPIPFGPYLAMAGAIALFYGKDLTAYYLASL